MLKKLTLIATAGLLMTAPVLAQVAQPDDQEGDQFLPLHLECEDTPLSAGGEVSVVPGATFELTSDDGDFDLFLYDANGDPVDSFQNPGDEAGTIHADAASGQVCLWGVHDPTGNGLPVPGDAHWLFTQTVLDNGR